MAAGATIQGAETVLNNITKFGDRFLTNVNATMQQIESKLREAIRKNISLTDHSLEDLAALGHPYAAAHPSNIHSPEYQVHSQSGAMLGMLYSGTSDASFNAGRVRAEAYAGIDEAIEYAMFVIMGTSKMIPRDFLTGSLDEMREEIFSILSSRLRDAVINFNGEKVRL